MFKTYETFLEDVEKFIDIKESMDFSEFSVLEKINTGNRLVDHIPNINESEDFASLTEEEKYELDNVLWEGILMYTIHGEELYEGWWSNVISGVRDLPKKALGYAKEVLGNVGKLIKDIAAWVKEFLKKGLELAKKGADKVWGSIKGKAEVKAEKMKKQDPKQIKVEVAHLKDIASWMLGSPDKMLDGGIKDAENAAEQAAKADDDTAEKLEDRIEKKIEGEQEKAKEDKEKEMRKRQKAAHHESMDVASLLFAINEMRKSPELDYENLVKDSYMYAEVSNEFNEYNEMLEKYGSDANVGDPKGDAEKKKSSIMSKIKEGFGIKNVLSILTSGIVSFAEKGIELIFKVGFNAFSKLCAKMGGPGPIEFVAIAALIAVTSGMILEFGMELLAEFTGLHALEAIAHALHATNPVYWLSKAAGMIHPAVGGIIKAAGVVTVIYLGIEHLQHAIAHGEHGHDDDHGHDDKKHESKLSDYQRFVNEVLASQNNK